MRSARLAPGPLNALRDIENDTDGEAGQSSFVSQSASLPPACLRLPPSGSVPFVTRRCLWVPIDLEVRPGIPTLAALPRKEVIQPHLPIRLPCYDFTPVIDLTFVRWPLAVTSLPSGAPNSHGVTGGVYKARERIHRDMLIRDY